MSSLGQLGDRRVLILDGELRSALAVVRSLGKAGAMIFVGASSPNCLAGASKYVTQEVLYENPGTAASEFVKNIVSICDKYEITDLLPLSEITLGTLLRNDELFTGVHFPYVDRNTYDLAVDKYRLAQVAAEVGVRAPQSILCENAAAVDAIFKKIVYPVVLKPVKSRVFADGRWVVTQVQYAKNAVELLQKIKADQQYQYPFMIQEFIEGDGKGVFLLYRHGRRIAHFSHRRIREKPPTGGVSVLSESVRIDEGLLDQANNLLDKLQWHGVAMVEFKLSGAGVPYLMEINPRFWGSLQLAIDSGVDFPVMLLTMQGGKIPVLDNYREGVRLRWLLGDVDNLLLVMKSSNYSMKQKVAAFFVFFDFFSKPTNYETLRFKDMHPFFREIKLYLMDIIKK